jgi:hypothetical protein
MCIVIAVRRSVERAYAALSFMMQMRNVGCGYRFTPPLLDQLDTHIDI